MKQIKKIFRIPEKCIHSFRRKKNEPITRIAAVASVTSVVPSYFDSNGQCYQIVVPPNISSLDNSFLDSFYQSKLKTFEAFQSGKVTLGNQDFQNIIRYHHSYVKDVCEITGRPYDQVLLDFADYHQAKQFLIQPQGVSGIIHKVTNSMYVSGAALQTTFATTTSHVSGVNGVALLGTAPGLIIFVPLVGGVFFGSLERIAVNTPVQPIFVLARDACLIPPKIAEIAYNEIFIGPILRKIGIDAPLNITSMLQFGNGTKRIMGGVVNATISTLNQSLPNLINKLQ